MPAGEVLRGTDGKVYKVGTPDVELEITKWSAQENADSERYATSKSGGAKLTEIGNVDLTAQIEGKRVVNPTNEKIETLFAIGAAVQVKLGFDASTGIQVTAKVKSRSFEVDVNTGAVQSYTMGIESHGAWTYY